nr:MAG TPA: hypothetical protein [Caudoviricetes sp.]
MACCVAITISAVGNSFLFFLEFLALLLEEAFLIFWELGVLTRCVLGLI